MNSRIHKVTEEYFREVKRTIRWTTNKRTATKHGLHLSTVINIRGSRNYEEYRQLVKAEHQPTLFSLKDHVLDLHKLVFDKKDNNYFPPKTARTAVTQLEFELAKS